MKDRRIKEDNLKRAVFILYDMELNNYLITRAIQKINAQIAPLGLEKNHTPPKKKQSKVSFWNIFGAIALNAVTIGVVLGAVAGVLSMFFGGNLISYILWPIAVPLFAAYGGLTGLAAAIIIAAVIKIISRSIKRKKNDAIYQNEYAEYQEKVLADKQRLEAEFTQKQTLTEQLKELKEKLEISEKLLLEFYEISELSIEFRHIIPVGYMYEYAKLGAANGLDGLCDLVRNDIKNNAAFNALSDTVDDHSAQQREIHRELRRSNGECDMMVNTEYTAAEQNEKISEYISERIVKEAEYQSYMMIFKANADTPEQA